MKTKRAILITLFTLATFSVFGQGKPKIIWQNNTVRLSENYTQFKDAKIGTVSATGSPLEISKYAGQPNSVWIYSGSKLMTRIEPKSNITNIDSLFIYVRKSQLRWVNDSVVVITKVTN